MGAPRQVLRRLPHCRKSAAEVETHRYRSEVSPKAVMGTLAAFECRYDLPIVWEPNPQAAATLVCRWAWYFAREVRKTFEAMTLPQPESNPQPKEPNDAPTN